MTDITLNRRLLGEIAVAVAHATLKSGDRLYVTRCGGRHVTVTYLDQWWGCWIVTASLDDIHPLSIVRVNGKPRPLAAEAAAILDYLNGSARKALLDDCARRMAERAAEQERILALATDSDDEVPW